MLESKERKDAVAVRKHVYVLLKIARAEPDGPVRENPISRNIRSKILVKVEKTFIW